MTKKIFLGGKGITKRISIGGDSPITLQTMWKEPINDLKNSPQKLEKIISKINDKNIDKITDDNV